MKHSNAFVVYVDVIKVVELLQHEMTWVVQDVAASVIFQSLQEHLEGDTVVQILAGMDLVAQIDPGCIEGIEDRVPASGQLVERGFHESGRTLRPWIDKWPGERARERCMSR